MMKSKLGMASLVAAAGLAMVVGSGTSNPVFTRTTGSTRRTSPNTLKIQRYQGQTHEQRVWNEEVDRKKAEKKAAKRAKRETQ